MGLEYVAAVYAPSSCSCASDRMFCGGEHMDVFKSRNPPPPLEDSYQIVSIVFCAGISSFKQEGTLYSESQTT